MRLLSKSRRSSLHSYWEHSLEIAGVRTHVARRDRSCQSAEARIKRTRVDTRASVEHQYGTSRHSCTSTIVRCSARHRRRQRYHLFGASGAWSGATETTISRKQCAVAQQVHPSAIRPPPTEVQLGIELCLPFRELERHTQLVFAPIESRDHSSARSAARHPPHEAGSISPLVSRSAAPPAKCRTRAATRKDRAVTLRNVGYAWRNARHACRTPVTSAARSRAAIATRVGRIWWERSFEALNTLGIENRDAGGLAAPFTDARSHHDLGQWR